MNLQPSEAEAGFDIRVPPTADLESLEKRIAEEWAPASRNMTFSVINLLFLYAKYGDCFSCPFLKIESLRNILITKFIFC